MNKKMYLFVISLLSILLAGPEGFAEKYALVIGNADYVEAPLRNPVNDAYDMTEALERMGFTVITATNVNQQKMEGLIRDFGNRLDAQDTALFYFSGHGVQADGENYLLPIGIDIASMDEIKYKSVNAGMILDKLDVAETRVNIVILDACRNNPFKRFRSLQRGLAMMSAPTGTLIAYATAPGSVAYDGDGRNSPYAKYLLDIMKTRGMKIEDVLKQVRLRVVDETEYRQVPWESSSLIGDFYFVPPSLSTPTPIPGVSSEAILATPSPGSAPTVQATIVSGKTMVGDYPQTSVRKLKQADLTGKTLWELSLMRNEIFARSGYIFKTQELQKHFEQQAWYVPRHKDVTVVSALLSELEHDNINMIKRYEQTQQAEQLQHKIPGKYPEASLKYLTDHDLENKSQEDLSIMRNEIFARHGHVFTRPHMKAYFENQSWYVPRTDDVYAQLSDIEKANIELIQHYERQAK
ncbi:hypothetical protein CSB45_02060 [candidate division KSB3 bacterium]|uniref:YARHG domain-containing protein n=1 Tax=candidate division KSB3 bacterium TaxID=2044937 RepID=A0A2G6E9M7_9BACT|nr:MAG: hypothetical protein CSB45_02060 [candidate division KSB3 bacterium]PIE30867.1 MAG: hypothetical protein CSA57_00670 [candidate division KSB3 bacterium]